MIHLLSKFTYFISSRRFLNLRWFSTRRSDTFGLEVMESVFSFSHAKLFVNAFDRSQKKLVFRWLIALDSSRLNSTLAKHVLCANEFGKHVKFKVMTIVGFVNWLICNQ